MPKRTMAFNTCWEDTVEDAKNIIGRGSIISPTEAQSFIAANENVIVLDVSVYSRLLPKLQLYEPFASNFRVA